MLDQYFSSNPFCQEQTKILFQINLNTQLTIQFCLLTSFVWNEIIIFYTKPITYQLVLKDVAGAKWKKWIYMGQRVVISCYIWQ